MNDPTHRNFGLLIAHFLPGFFVLWGLQSVSPTASLWLNSAMVTEGQVPTVGGFLYVALASVALGMTVGAIRWCVIDWTHHATGLPRPVWDDAKLQANFDAFGLLVEHHYRYYQFHANSLVAILVVYGVHRYAHGFSENFGGMELGLTAFAVVFWATSRSNLQRYYDRVTALMDPPPGDRTMSNGSHKPSDTNKPTRPTQASKPEDKKKADKAK